MRTHPSFDPRKALKRGVHETAALGVRLVVYLGFLAVLAVGAVTLWDGLPDTVAQARQVAITAGWTVDAPPLRGSL